MNKYSNYKLFKWVIRYAKENNQFNTLKQHIDKYGIKGNDLTAIKILPYDANLHNCIRYYKEPNSGFAIFLFKMFKAKIIQGFEDFLKENNIKELYYKNLDENFIRRTTQHNEDNFSDKKTFINKTIAPLGYIVDAFNWADTSQGYRFWLETCEKWEKTFYELIEKNSK